MLVLVAPITLHTRPPIASIYTEHLARSSRKVKPPPPPSTLGKPLGVRDGNAHVSDVVNTPHPTGEAKKRLDLSAITPKVTQVCAKKKQQPTLFLRARLAHSSLSFLPRSTVEHAYPGERDVVKAVMP